MHSVFVYGTLRNDYQGGMAKMLRDNSKFVTRGILCDYSLHDLGGFPFATYNEGQYFYGHLFQDVPDEVLERLDSYEGYPDHYNRHKVTITGDDGNKYEGVYVYAYDEPDKRVKQVHEWKR